MRVCVCIHQNPKACLAQGPKKRVTWVLSCFCAQPEFFENSENGIISLLLIAVSKVTHCSGRFP